MNAIYFAEIVISVALIGIILVQAKGGGGLGGIFGGAQSSGGYRTRRGVEQTLFRFTIVLGAIFVLIAAVSTKIN